MWEKSKPVENFYKSLCEPNLAIIAGKQALKCSGEGQLCSFFYGFKIREGTFYMKEGESKVGIGLEDS